MSAVYSIYTSPNHAPIPNHLPTLIVTPHGQPHHTLYSYIHTNYNRETYLLTPSPQGDLCVAKMVPPPGSRGSGGGGSDSSHSAGGSLIEKSVRCEASRNLKWAITNTGIHAPVYKLTLPNPDAPGNEQPLFQISKPNPNAGFWTMFYFTYAGHLIPPKRIEFGRIQKNSAATAGGAGAGAGSTPASSGGGGTRVSITGKTPEEKAVWQTLGEGNEDMVEWIVLCAALNVLDEEIIRAAEKSGGGVGGGASAARPTNTQRPTAQPAASVNRGPPALAVPSSRPSARTPSPASPATGPRSAAYMQGQRIAQGQARPPPPGGGGYPVRPAGGPPPMGARPPPPPGAGQMPMPQRGPDPRYAQPAPLPRPLAQGTPPVPPGAAGGYGPQRPLPGARPMPNGGRGF